MVARLAHQVAALLVAQLGAHPTMVAVAVAEILPLVQMELQLRVVLAVRVLQTASLVQASLIRVVVAVAHTMVVLLVLAGQVVVVQAVLGLIPELLVLLAQQT
jgi:hypothetical protein